MPFHYTKKGEIPKNKTTLERERNGERPIYVLIDPKTKKLTRYRGWRDYDVAKSQIKGMSVVSSVDWLRGHFKLDRKRNRKEHQCYAILCRD